MKKMTIRAHPVPASGATHAAPPTLAAARLAAALAALAAGLLWLAPAAAAQETPQPDTAPPGWIGIWLACDACEIRRGEGVSAWIFHDPPVVVDVADDSPALAAGFQAGDTILRINGLGLTSREGGRAFGSLVAGRAVALVVRRNGAERTIRIVPGRRPEKVEEKRTPKAKAYQRVEELRPLVQAHLDSLLPLMRARLDSLHVRWQVEVHPDSLGRLAERERWMQIYRDSIRIQLDSLAVHVWPMPAPMPEAAPRARRAYGFGYEIADSAAVAVGHNAVAGAKMTSLGEELGAYFPGTDGGVLVLEVAEGTPAARAGLKPGDVILSVRGERVRSVQEVRRALRPYPQPVQCEVVRKGEKVRVTIQGRGRAPSPTPRP